MISDASRLVFWERRLPACSSRQLAANIHGLYGAVAYGVAQRTREIGIRIALGATRGSILCPMLGQGMSAVAIGLAVGVGGALIVSRVLNASLFGVSGRDLASYGAACLALALTAAIASLIPARRAALVSPMEALRTE